MESDELIDPAPEIKPNYPYLIITSPIFIKGNLGKFVSYTIRGKDAEGPIETQKRYNDFKKLRKNMISVWGGTYIPPLPYTKFIGESDPVYIENRRKILEKFLQQCSKIPHLYACPTFQQFLRSPSPVNYEPLSVFSVKSLLECTFPAYKDAVYNPEHKGQLFHAIKNFETSLTELKIMKNAVDKVCKNIFKYQKSVNSFMEAFVILSGVYLCKSTNARTRDMLLNPYWVLQDWVNSEILDTEAMIEAINQLYVYDNNILKLQNRCQEELITIKALNEGKKPLKSLFKDINTLVLEHSDSLTALTNELNANEAIRNLLYHYMIDVEIFKFISNKSTVFHKCLKEYIDQNTDEFEHQIDLINTLSSNI